MPLPSTPEMRRALLATAREWSRLDDFLKQADWPADAGVPRAELVCPRVVIATSTHGIFELDAQEVLAALRHKRELLQAELQAFLEPNQTIKDFALSLQE